MVAAWYDNITAGTLAIGGALTTVVVGLGGALIKAWRELSRSRSEIKVEKVETHARGWVMDRMEDIVAQADARADRAEAARDATITAAKVLVTQRETDVAQIARQEEKLANAMKDAAECEERARRAEGRAAVAEEHMRKQTEQMLMMGINIDALTTALAKHDPAEAARLTPKRRAQPLLDYDPDEEGKQA